LEPKCRGLREKAAWADCVELYEDAILQINKSVESTSGSDSQTWLSTALTNFETCKSGFVDFGITDNVLPLISKDDNVSALISSALALNRDHAGDYGGRSYSNGGFPKWVSPRARKLLQSASIPADIVVANDGSGNYTTVSAAVAAVGKNSGKTLVIHVKQGTYNENVVIGNGLTNIMLVGDGIGKTIIT
ncbi:pectinesterase, partial [Genlisea aurea]